MRWLITVHKLQVLPIAGIGIPGFGRKDALYPCIGNHRSLHLSNPEKCCRFIHILYCQKHGLDCTDGKKCGFTTNTGKPRLFCLLFQLQGKVSALPPQRRTNFIINHKFYFYPALGILIIPPLRLKHLIFGFGKHKIFGSLKDFCYFTNAFFN